MKKRFKTNFSQDMRKFYAFILTILCFVLFQQSIEAQTKENQQKSILEGIVVDVNGAPIIGASILVKGTTIGTITDTDGKFKLAAPNSGLILVSYVGYDKIEMPINSKKIERIVLTENSKSLEEVVVVGYGTVRRGDLTGSISSANVSDMSKAPVVSFDNALAGRVAGLQVSTNDGQPGAQSNIVIRGASSITQNISPIYVVDGFIFEDFDPNSINPQDIESINVLKDASSTAIYGSRGANGVIIVTTKVGKIGKPIVSYNTSIGINDVTKRMELMNSYEFIKLQIERYPDVARSVYFSDIPSTEAMDPELYRNAPTIDWQDKVFRTGTYQSHSLSLSGGSSITKYLVSLGYYEQGGTVINTDYNKINGRFSLDQVINNKLSLKLNVLYTRDHASGIVPTDVSISGTATSSLFYSVYGYRPIASLDEEDNQNLENSIIDDDPNINLASDYRLNPVIMAMNEQKNSISTVFTPSLNLNYKLNDKWSFLLRGGIDSRVYEKNYFYNSKTRIGYIRPGTSGAGVQGGVSFYEYSLLSNENIVTYSDKFADIHKIEIQSGLSFQKIATNYNSFGYQQIPYEDLGLSGMDMGVPVPGTTWLNGSNSMSVFGRINYNILSRYLFTSTLRADASSKFPAKNRWGYFPSLAFAWRMSDESFFNKLDYIDNAKLRISYGITGNNRVGDFDYYAQLTSPYSGYYSFDNSTPKIGAERTSLGNPDLKWESTYQTNIGYDISLLKSRINFTVDIYRKVTKDLLLRANLPATTGLTSAYKNIGSIKNDGLELTLSTINIKNKSFSWSTDFNISFNKNRVLSLNSDEDIMYSSVSWDSNYNSTPLYITQVDKPVSEFWGIEWDGVYQYSDFDLTNGKYVLKSDITTNGNPRDKIQPGDIKYKDQDGDLTVNASDRVVIGNPFPKHTGGFGNTLTYGNFSLNIFFQWSYGNDIFNANRLYFEGGYNVRPLQNQFASFADRWTPENQTNKMFRSGVAGSTGAGPNGVYSSMDIEDGSYLRLKTLALEYKLPQNIISKLKLKNVSLGIAAQNIFTWTSYSGLDPEVSVRNTILTPGFDYSSYPRSLSTVFNLKVTL